MDGDFKYALFDFDGVIVNSEPTRLRTYKSLFHKVYGIDIDIDPLKLVGRSESFNLKKFLQNHNLESSEDSLRLLKKQRSQLLMDAAEKGLPPNEAVIFLIEELQSLNVPMGIVTNSTPDYLEIALGSLGLDPNDFYRITAHDVLFSKPNPEGYLKAIEGMGVNAEDGLAFEDSIAGLQAIDSAELCSLAVLSTYTARELNATLYLNPNEKTQTLEKIISLFGK